MFIEIIYTILLTLTFNDVKIELKNKRHSRGCKMVQRRMFQKALSIFERENEDEGVEHAQKRKGHGIERRRENIKARKMKKHNKRKSDGHFKRHLSHPLCCFSKGGTLRKHRTSRTSATAPKERTQSIAIQCG